MSANTHRPHLLVIPEDDANRQLANGFVQSLQVERQRQIQVLRPAGGWMSALTRFEKQESTALDRFPHRNVLLLIDFDGRVDDRLAHCRRSIFGRHANRVFILGVRCQPEDLKRALPVSTFEAIGAALADECRTASWDKWNHELLACNTPERARLHAALPVLFT